MEVYFTATCARVTSFVASHLIPLLAVLALLVPSTTGAESASRQVRSDNPPAWVESIGAGEPLQTDHHDLPGGQSLALFDQQINEVTTQCFVHVVKDIVNETGVQSGANLTFSFDPSYQELTLHGIAIQRGAQRLNRLSMASVRIIQQETDLDRQIYNGTLSAVVFLDDVRVGDRIEYSFTTDGENPALKNRSTGGFAAGFSVPVQRLRYRLLLPDSRSLRYKAFGTLAEPVMHSRGDLKEYLWEWQGLHATLAEDQAPSWFPMYPWIQVSEFQDWRDVADWAVGLYVSTNRDSVTLRQCVESLRNSGVSAEQQVEAALRFVQNDIRYLGIEFGPNSYRPTDPAAVLQRRFGDCKDKAFLLCEILRRLGFNATPALVSTRYLHTIADMLPSPYVFDHVIVRVEVGPLVYWIDPTRTYQHGPLAKRFVPDYGCALLARPGETGLTVIPRSFRGEPETVTSEDFWCAKQKFPAGLDVVTTATGLDAEWLRATIASQGRDGLARAWLNDYSRHYPGIRQAGPLTIDDSSQLDVVRVSHSYEITNFWGRSADGQTYSCSFLPQGIHAWIEKPTTTIRAMPISLSYPRRRSVTTTVHLAGAWPMTNSSVTITSPGVQLAIARTWEGRTLTMTYDYWTLTNVVSGWPAEEHLRCLGQMNEKIGYVLTWQNEESVANQGRINWPILIVATVYGLSLCAGMAVVLRRFGMQRVTSSALPEPLGVAVPTDLGGWLILVALGIVFTAMSCITTIWRSSGSYARPVWTALTHSGGMAYHPGWLPMLAGELFGNITVFFLAAFLLILFFQRHTLFPRVFVFYLLFALGFTLLDSVGAHMMKAVLPPQTLSMTWQVTGKTMLACLIWIPYVRVSRRVRTTFVRGRFTPSTRGAASDSAS